MRLNRKWLVSWAVCCALVVFGISAAAYAQEEEEEPQSQGILPVPDYSGDFWTRPALTGDWGGTRQKWADDGFTFELDWYQVGQGIVSGGRDQHWAYSTNLDYYVKLDLMRMDLIPGAVVTVRGQSRFGRTVNEDTGLLLPVNTYSFFPYTRVIDDNVPIAVTELNWLQFLSDSVGVVAGKITTMPNSNEFAGGEGKRQFMNFQFLFPAVVAQTAPYSTLAIGGVFLPTPNVTVTTTLMNTTDSSTQIGFGDIGDGTTWATSVDCRYQLGDLPGGATVGGIYAFDGDFGRVGGLNIDPGGGISLETKSSTWAFYLSGWQYLFTEKEDVSALDPGNGRQDLEGLGLFAILGLGDRTTNPVTWSIALGLAGRGSIPGRADDTWGVGYFYNNLEEVRTIVVDELGRSVQGLEAYYNISIAEAAELTLNFQWANSAVQSLDNSITLGFRLNLSF